jgi:alpha-galactosidase
MGTPIKVTVIGAGSVVFSLALVKDICLTEGLGGSHITFMDIHEGRLNAIYNLATRFGEDLGSDLTFSKTLNRQEALQDADFVVNTATGTDEYMMRAERELADARGYYYGRTGLPYSVTGNIQLMLSIAQDMERICPDAWIVQAGNPVFDGTTAVTRETSIKMVGLCHGHYGYRGIAQVLGLDPDKITWQAPGLNHNIWLTDFYYEGQDAYPLIDQWIAEKAEQFWAERQQTEHGIPTQMSPAAIHQYHMYGLMPIGDTPRRGGWWYHTDPETRVRWYGKPIGGGDTPEGRNRIIDSKEKKFADITKAAFDATVRPIDLFGSERSREQHVPIIDALVNDHEGQFQVNVRNDGALPGLPDDVAVEVPAVVNMKGIQPLRVPPLPKKVMLECIYPDWLEMERTLEAIKSCDRSMLLFDVLESHQTRSYDQAVEILEATLALEHNKAMDGYYEYPAALPKGLL